MTVTVRVEGRDDRHSIACTPPPTNLQATVSVGRGSSGELQTHRPSVFICWISSTWRRATQRKPDRVFSEQSGVEAKRPLEGIQSPTSRNFTPGEVHSTYSLHSAFPGSCQRQNLGKNVWGGGARVESFPNLYVQEEHMKQGPGPSERWTTPHVM